MRRLLREPLVQFLLGGGALFLLYGATTADRRDRVERIVVSEQRVESLATAFRRTWSRPPTQAELDDLVQEFVNEEILYRESLALGLDRDDPVVRRRMRQKMEFLHADLSEPREPTNEDLAAYLSAHPDRFREPARVSFAHVFVKPEGRALAAARRADELLARLRGGAEAAALGDPTLLPEQMDSASRSDIVSVFGPGFADDLLLVSGGEWSGPIASSFGLHLVRISSRAPERLPELAAVRAQVEREWKAEQRAQANGRFLEALRDRYDVEIRMPVGDVAATLGTPTP